MGSCFYSYLVHDLNSDLRFHFCYAMTIFHGSNKCRNCLKIWGFKRFHKPVSRLVQLVKVNFHRLNWLFNVFYAKLALATESTVEIVYVFTNSSALKLC